MTGHPPQRRGPELDEPDDVDDGAVMVDEVDDSTVMVDESTVMVDEVDDSTVMVDEVDDSTVLVDGGDSADDVTRLVAGARAPRAPALAEPVLVPVQRGRSRPVPRTLPADPWAPPPDGASARVEPERYAPRPVPPAPPAVTIPDGAAPLREAAPRMRSVARSTRRWAQLTVAVWAVVTVVCCAGAALLLRVVLH